MDEYCIWRLDTSLQSLKGYFMTCVKPEGTTRIFSYGPRDFNYCPFCGKPLVVADSA